MKCRGGWLATAALLGFVVAMLLAGVPAAHASEAAGPNATDYAVRSASDVWVSWDHPPDDSGDKLPIDVRRNVSTETTTLGVIVGNDREEPIENVTLAFRETPAGVDARLGESYAGAPSPDGAAFWPRITSGDFGPVMAKLEASTATNGQGSLTALVVFESPDGERYATTDTLGFEIEDTNRAPSDGALAAIVLGTTALGLPVLGRS